jgi:hypothetical protein
MEQENYEAIPIMPRLLLLIGDVQKTPQLTRYLRELRERTRGVVFRSPDRYIASQLFKLTFQSKERQ